MPELRDLIADLTHELENGRISEALLSVEWIVQDALGLRRAELISQAKVEVTGGKELEIREKIARRLAGEPVQYIVGYTNFYGFRIEVKPGVLIPRSETEELVSRALELIPMSSKSRVLDIGTGSGCIAIAIKKSRPDAQVLAIDVSPIALEVASRNALNNSVVVDFTLHDATNRQTAEAIGLGSIDVVVSNPPYISYSERDGLQREVRDFEPEEALFADADGTGVFERSMPITKSLLRRNGFAIFEVHSERAERFGEMLAAAGFADVTIFEDLEGRPRIVQGRRDATS